MYWNKVVTLCSIILLYISVSARSHLLNSHNVGYYHESYLTPGKCNLNARTKYICKILSKSKKFKNILTRSPTRASPRPSIPTAVNFPASHFQNHYYTRDYESVKNNGIEKETPQNSYILLKVPRLSRYWKKHEKYLNLVWPKLKKWAELPLIVSGAPLMLTFTSAILFSNVKKRKFKKRKIIEDNSISEEDSEEESEEEEVIKKNEDKEKLDLAKEIIGLTAESFNLAANKQEFINVIARTGTEGIGIREGGVNGLSAALSKLNATNSFPEGTLNSLNTTHKVNAVRDFVKGVTGMVVGNSTLSSSG